MIKNFIYISLGLILLACNNKEATEEVISIEDLIGGKNEDTLTDHEVTDTVVIVTDSTTLGPLVLELADTYDTSTNKMTTLFDRFSVIAREKVSFLSKDSLSGQVDLFYYSFKDTNALNNAIYNWMDCFGKGCYEITPGENIAVKGEVPMWCNIYQDKLILVRFGDQQFELNSALIKVAGKLFSDKPKYQFKISDKQKLTWE